MVVLTATLAAALSAIGSYYADTVHTRLTIAQKQFELRAMAYNTFLENIGPTKTPAIGQLFSIGAMADHLATDQEIQTYEDQVADFLRRSTALDRYWQMVSSN